MEAENEERSTATEPELESIRLEHDEGAYVIFHPENLEAWLWSTAAVDPMA